MTRIAHWQYGLAYLLIDWIFACADRQMIRLGLPILTAMLTVLPSAEVVLAEGDPGMQSGELIVLSSGRVIRGEITPRPDGYDVDMGNGRIYIPSDSIRFHANDMDDAYLKMRESLPELTPSEHVALARWCLTNKLDQKAKRELLDALHLDPYRDDARQMLNALVRKLQQKNSQTASVENSVLSDRLMSSGGSSSVAARSLGGLSRPLARAFVTTVQPLLSNKCGNASCHGGSVAREFQIQFVRQMSSPVKAEQNLAAVLNQLSFDQPESSPLLRYAESIHGGSRVPFFRGRNGSAQIQVLKDWVQLACSEIGGPVQKSKPSLNLPMTQVETDLPSALQTERPNGSPVQLASLVERSLAMESAAHQGSVNKTVTDKRALQEAQKANRFDAYDASVFNQRHHGNKASRKSADSGVQSSASGTTQNSTQFNRP